MTYETPTTTLAIDALARARIIVRELLDGVQALEGVRLTTAFSIVLEKLEEEIDEAKRHLTAN